ncbi:MAG: hypothetical protein BMS9Abin28_0688 [Anaerolineae bacterium]|nr:MAG: hypothetical protein BMS9Abin28_0688 [Anaerolineae bacterium]
MKLRIRFALFPGVLLLLAACAPSAAPEPAPPANLPGAAESSDFERVSDFELVVYQGQEVLGGDIVRFQELLDQGKPVVLNFWAGLCPPCRVEMPDLQEVYDEYGDRMLLVGLDVGPFVGLGSQADAQALLTELAVTYPAGTTTDANVVVDYGLLGMPTTYFISPEGELVDTWTGLLTKDKLVELVEQLLEASAS